MVLKGLEKSKILVWDCIVQVTINSKSLTRPEEKANKSMITAMSMLLETSAAERFKTRVNGGDLRDKQAKEKLRGTMLL